MWLLRYPGSRHCVAWSRVGRLARAAALPAAFFPALSAALFAALLAGVPAVCFALGESVNGFPKWEERVIHAWINRARSDPQVEMTACGPACGEKTCYAPIAPLSYDLNLNRAARFHSDRADPSCISAEGTLRVLKPWHPSIESQDKQ